MFCIIQRCCQDEYAAYEIAQINRWTKQLKIGFALDVTLVAAASILCVLTLCAHFNLPMGLLNCLNRIPSPLLFIPAFVVLFIIILDCAKLFSKCCQKKTTLEKPKPQHTNIEKPRPQNSKFFAERLPLRESESETLSWEQESEALIYSERSERSEKSPSNHDIINLEKALSKTKVRPSWEKKRTRTNIDGTSPSVSE